MYSILNPSDILSFPGFELILMTCLPKKRERERMNTIILVVPPFTARCKTLTYAVEANRTLLGVAAMFLTNATQSANVLTCAAVKIPSSTSLGNPGGSSSLIELAISCTICFVSFFEPVAIASTQASSVGVTNCYRTSSSASASNYIYVIIFIYALSKNKILLPCLRVTLYYVILEKRSYT